MSDHETTFFPKPVGLTLGEIANTVGATLQEGVDKEVNLSGVAPLEDAGRGHLSFFDNPKYLSALGQSNATACICAPKFKDRLPDEVICLEVNDPYRAFATAAALFYPLSMRPVTVQKTGTVSPLAYVSKSAVLEEGVTVEAFAYIDDEVVIGAGSIVGSHAKISQKVKIGRDCSITSHVCVQHTLIGDRVILHPGVKVGQDGFGFAMSPQGHLKVPQVGRVIIQDDVEIGANTTVDRGANRDTIIGEGTKIDNQVQIGHNVVVGRHCIIVSQVGISGSTTLEDFVAIGGQSGVNGHVTIGMGSQIAAVSVVHGDVPPGSRWGGVPARPVREWFKEQQLLKRMVRKDLKK